MTTSVSFRLAGALALAFTAMAAPAVAVADSYEVVQIITTPPGTFIMGDRPLPPAGAARDAQSRWLKQIPFIHETYLVQLRGARGDFVQCVGFRISPVDRKHDELVTYRTYDPLADDPDLLRALWHDKAAPAWPLARGGCVALDSAHTNIIENNRISFRQGATLEGGFTVPMFGPETPVERGRKDQMALDGHGVSLTTNLGTCESAGWNDTLATARVGQAVTIPALCPR
jgi:hypothetical protein